jgi:hypothetical protein
MSATTKLVFFGVLGWVTLTFYHRGHPRCAKCHLVTDDDDKIYFIIQALSGLETHRSNE